MSCERCGSFAINHAAHGRDGSEPSLCDVCYWRQRTEQCTASNAAKDAEIASLRECGLAIGALSSAMGNPCVKANENGISGGLVALALHRMVEKDAEIATIREELRVTDQLLTERDRLLKSVPECKAHGDQCVPHAIEWVQSAAGEIARLREALSVIAYPLNIGKVYHMDAVTQARAALAQAAEVGNG